MKPRIREAVFRDLKLFFIKKSLCLAFAMVMAICLEKVSLEVKFIPRSKTSFTSGSATPANSNFTSVCCRFLFLFVINNHFDFSFDIGSCHVSAESVILFSVLLNFFFHLYHLLLKNTVLSRRRTILEWWGEQRFE